MKVIPFKFDAMFKIACRYRESGHSLFDLRFYGFKIDGN